MIQLRRSDNYVKLKKLTGKGKRKMDAKRGQSYTMAVISTYKEMSRKLVSLAAQENITVIDIFGSFTEAQTEALRIESEVDAILCRGSTVPLLREVVSVPVVDIPNTPLDLLIAIGKLPENVTEVAYFGYQHKLLDVEVLEQFCNKRIYQFVFNNVKEMSADIARVVELGIPAVVGSGRVLSFAQAAGLQGVELSASNNGLLRVLHEAKTLVDLAYDKEVEHLRYRMALDSLSEGILLSDEEHNILACNPAVKKIFKISDHSELNSHIMGDHMEDAYKTKNTIQNYLQKIDNSMINISHYPVQYENSFLGVVSTYQDVTKIQGLELQIRKKLRDNGFLAKHTLDDILTKSDNMETLKEDAALYARTDSAILIEGESGTGKELFAQGIHNASLRSDGPFVAVNCAAIPESLLESELFGYEDGAFTGAKKGGKLGLFELANHGTIFLDEIGEMPKHIQARLLRVLQEKEVRHVGGSKNISIDCRVISATNKNLFNQVAEGEFREDLYYRLCVFHIYIPPLRERKNDIPVIFENILKNRVGVTDLLDEVSFRELSDLLRQYDWPGNIRELSNVAERCALLLPSHTDLMEKNKLWKRFIQPGEKVGQETNIKVDLAQSMKEIIEQVEREIILRTMSLYENDRIAVMEHLGISRTTLWRKLGENPSD